MGDYKILPLKLEDKEEATNFMRAHFMKSEALSTAFGLLKNRSSNPEIEGLYFSSLNTPINFKAVSGDGKIIGVKLNYLATRANIGKKLELTDEANQEMFKFIRFVDETTDVFGKYPKVDRILSGIALGVDSAWSGRGIGAELMEKTWEATREQNCGLMKIFATSSYTSKILVKMGFRCIYSLSFKDYEGHEGLRSYTQPPYTSGEIFVKENAL